MSKSGVIRLITKHGTPIIVAVDVQPAPKSIEKVTSSLGAEIFVPQKSLGNMEKSRIVKEFVKKHEKKTGEIIKVKGKHQRDALAAAIKAWKSNQYLLRKVRNALRKERLEGMYDEVVRMIVDEESDNINNAIKKVAIIKDRQG